MRITCQWYALLLVMCSSLYLSLCISRILDLRLTVALSPSKISNTDEIQELTQTRVRIETPGGGQRHVLVPRGCSHAALQDAIHACARSSRIPMYIVSPTKTPLTKLDEKLLPDVARLTIRMYGQLFGGAKEVRRACCCVSGASFAYHVLFRFHNPILLLHDQCQDKRKSTGGSSCRRIQTSYHGIINTHDIVVSVDP